MNEMTKSLIYVGLAAGAMILGVASRPTRTEVALDEKLGKPLFEFEDSTKATSMTIKTHGGTGDPEEFRVRSVEGRWVIPSHNDYPADAENRIRDAATAFVDLRVKDVVGDKTSREMGEYGLIDPSGDTADADAENIGTLVQLGVEDGTAVDLIIGKEEPGSEGRRFVRQPGQDRIYTVEFDLEKLPTKFEDWINRDLLDVERWNISQIGINDYSLEPQRTPSGNIALVPVKRLEMFLEDENGKWSMSEFREFRDGSMQDSQLTAAEELNKERLDGLKDALDSLEIVDVQKKPTGLGADLQAGTDFINDRSKMESLAEHGFYAVPGEDGVDFYSSDGEIVVRSDDGVERILRFGSIASVGDEKDGDTQLNRYLMVAARVNEDKFPEPILEALPEDAPVGPDADTPEEGAEEESADEADTNTTSESSEGKSEEEAAADESEEKDELQAEIERINRDNQLKIDKRNDDIKAATEKAQELNYRFAEWYYVISEDVFKKIHLNRADIIKEKEITDTEGTGIGDFYDLNLEEEDTVEQDSPVTPGAGPSF